MIDIAEETLGFRRWRFSRHLRLLIPTFSLLNAPANFTVHLHSNQNAPLPLDDFEKDRIIRSRLILIRQVGGAGRI